MELSSKSKHKDSSSISKIRVLMECFVDNRQTGRVVESDFLSAFPLSFGEGCFVIRRTSSRFFSARDKSILAEPEENLENAGFVFVESVR